MSTTAFGRIIVPTQIEYAARDLLKKWFPTYLREIERQMDWAGEALPAPRNYTNRNSFDALAGEEMPKVVVISPGLIAIPTHPESNGYYKSLWQVGVGIAVAARTEEEADYKCKMYGAAARAILIQHQDFENEELEVIGVHWLDEAFDDLVMEDQFANYKSASVTVGVEVDRVTSRFMRPPEPIEDPQIIEEVETVITTIPEWEVASQVPDA